MIYHVARSDSRPVGLNGPATQQNSPLYTSYQTTADNDYEELNNVIFADLFPENNNNNNNNNNNTMADPNWFFAQQPEQEQLHYQQEQQQQLQLAQQQFQLVHQQQQQQSQMQSVRPQKMHLSQIQPPSQQLMPYSYVPPSNSREMRNRSEKQRRDRLNDCISAMAKENPLIANHPKRLDKITVLRTTAGYLHIQQVLQNPNLPHMDLPSNINQYVLQKVVFEDEEQFFLLADGTGKILYTDGPVEKVIGHSNVELENHSLYTFTHDEDRDLLRNTLECDKMDRRISVFIRLRRGAIRSEAPQYQSVHLTGSLVVNRSKTEFQENDGSRTVALCTAVGDSLNYKIFSFYVKAWAPQELGRPIELKIEGYKTRHLVDGTIVETDHQISLIAGYFSQEVRGQNAFFYIHKSDMRYALVALKEMFSNQAGSGYSCYRLKKGTGEFIYLRTSGALEMRNGEVECFTCINLMVDETEGLRLLGEMRRRYKNIANSKLLGLDFSDENGEDTDLMAAVPSIKSPGVNDTTEDPQTVQAAVSALMHDLIQERMESRQSQSSQIEEIQEPELGQISTAQFSQQNLQIQEPLMPRHFPVSSKPKGKRPYSKSPNHVKRHRLNSQDSEIVQMSPSSSGSPLNISDMSPYNFSNLTDEDEAMSPNLLQNYYLPRHE